MLIDASIYNDNMTLLQAYKSLAKRVKALEESGGGGGSYTLPTASATVKGGVKIGNNLRMDGEVLSAIGGGGGGSVSFVWDWAQAEGADGGLQNPPDGFTLGWGDMIEFPFVDQYPTQIEAVNEEDETDTKIFYLPNNTFPSFDNIKHQMFNPGSPIPLNLVQRYEQRYIGSPSGTAKYPLYAGSTQFPVFDVEDQSGKSDEDLIYNANIITQEEAPVGYTQIYIGGLFPSLNSTLNGTITEMNIVDTQTDKTYHWTGSIAYRDIFSTGRYDAWRLQYSYLHTQ